MVVLVHLEMLGEVGVRLVTICASGDRYQSRAGRGRRISAFARLSAHEMSVGCDHGYARARPPRTTKHAPMSLDDSWQQDDRRHNAAGQPGVTTAEPSTRRCWVTCPLDIGTIAADQLAHRFELATVKATC